MKHRAQTLILILLCSGLAIAWFKAGMLQLIRGDSLKHLSERQYLRSLSYPGYRGDILDRNGKLLSTSVPVESIYAEPRKIEHPKTAAEQIKKIDPRIPQKAIDRLSSDRSFIWLARRVDPNISSQIEDLSINGIGLAKEERRFYPNHTLLGQTLGLLSIDGIALSGIEKSYNDYLQPKPWNTIAWNDARGKNLRQNIAPDQNVLRGNNLTLTIDLDIQYVAEQALLRAVSEHGAKGGWAIVIEPKTGEVLALANVPLVNPNYTTNVSPEQRRNNAVSRTGEPGSTFKMLTFAAAFDAGVITPEDQIFCENGVWDLGYMKIRDISKKEWLTPGEIFKYSSNIGTFKIAEKVGKEKLYDTIKKLGFGSSPGLNLIEEAKGYVSEPKTWGKARFANISFGYGIMASSFQMAMTAATIANGGIHVPPRIVLDSTPIKPSTRVLSEKAATALTALMIEDTVSGTGKRAAISGISVAGKTGTAEKLGENTGRYDKSLNMSSFVGFAPADKPTIVAMVVIDEPKGVAYGGIVAAPAWREIVRTALAKQGHFFSEDGP